MTTVTLPTFAELYQSAKEEIQARNPSLTDFNEGSNLDAIAGAGAMLADEVLRYVIARFSAQFVDTAAGADLDALALDRFGLVRKLAQAAFGRVAISRGSSTATVPVPAGTIVTGEVDGQKVEFTTLTPSEIASGTSSTTARVACTTTGPGGNVDVGAIDTISGISEDPGLTVTNTERMVGGRVAESDERFRVRIRRYFQTLRRGTVEALVAGATLVGGCDFATVDETHIKPENGGYVAVYVGDPDGNANAELVAEVATALESWRSAGVWVRVFAAEREEVDLQLVVKVRTAADVDTIRDTIRGLVLALVDAIAPQATLYRSQVVARAFGASQDIVDIQIDTPAADVSPSTVTGVLRVPSSRLSISVSEV